MKYYHASPLRNLRSIKLKGLKSVNKDKTISVASSIRSLKGGFLHEFNTNGDSPRRAVFEVDTKGLTVKSTDLGETESYIVGNVSPDRLKLVGVYNNRQGIWETPGSIPRGRIHRTIPENPDY